MYIKKGYKSWNKGLTGVYSEETREKFRLTKMMDKNPNWKGDSIIDRGMLHDWLRRYIPKPDLCPICDQKPPYDLANITGVYNREFKNWQYQCRGCHMRSDGRINNLKRGR